VVRKANPLKYDYWVRYIDSLREEQGLDEAYDALRSAYRGLRELNETESWSSFMDDTRPKRLDESERAQIETALERVAEAEAALRDARQRWEPRERGPS
jgi:hypothetical protein